jgi:hypothetical protein
MAGLALIDQKKAKALLSPFFLVERNNQKTIKNRRVPGSLFANPCLCFLFRRVLSAP